MILMNFRRILMWPGRYSMLVWADPDGTVTWVVACFVDNGNYLRSEWDPRVVKLGG